MAIASFGCNEIKPVLTEAQSMASVISGGAQAFAAAAAEVQSVQQCLGGESPSTATATASASVRFFSSKEESQQNPVLKA